MENFLFNFTTVRALPTSEEVENRTARSKAAWFAITGLGKQTETRTPPKK